jgi:hypothetical protein
MKNYLLQTMGIQTWKARRVLPGSNPKVTYHVHPLYRSDILPRHPQLSPRHPERSEGSRECGKEQRVGSLYLEIRPCERVEEIKSFDLLKAMLAAIGLHQGSESQECEIPKTTLNIFMGLSVAQQVLNSVESLDELRKKNICVQNNISILVTYHPLDLLAQPQNKAKAWEDLKKILTIQ